MQFGPDMSVTSVTSASNVNIAKQLSTEIDANKDGLISTNEFGTFILNVLEGKSSTSTATTAFRSALTSDTNPGVSTGPYQT